MVACFTVLTTPELFFCGGSSPAALSPLLLLLLRPMIALAVFSNSIARARRFMAFLPCPARRVASHHDGVTSLGQDCKFGSFAIHSIYRMWCGPEAKCQFRQHFAQGPGGGEGLVHAFIAMFPLAHNRTHPTP
eukprot:scaffold119360_cov57-Phaeocystis_antarctica.AAC.1